MITLQLSTTKDIPIICKLAGKIWHDHYISIVSLDQISYMLARAYSVEALESQMREGQMFYLINNENNSSIGYVAFTQKQPGHWFMNKFYIDTDRQGKGIGAEVLKLWEQMEKPVELTLQVNRKNHKSINFYFKNGFKIREVADFNIGNGFSMDDFVMGKMY